MKSTKYILLCGLIVASLFSGYLLGKYCHYYENNIMTDQVNREQIPLPALKNNYIDPTVKVVIAGNDYDDTTHSYHRLIERNTELDPCLTLEKVSVYTDNAPSILSSDHLCSFKINNVYKTISKDTITDIEYTNFKYDKNFVFDVSIDGARPTRCDVFINSKVEIVCSSQ